jgi:hypothetical protein
MKNNNKSVFGKNWTVAIREGYYDPQTQSIGLTFNIDNFLKDPINLSILLHELLHFWQGLGTSYGFYYAELSALKYHRIIHLIRVLKRLEVKKFYCPFYRWLNFEQDPNVKNILNIICTEFYMINYHLQSMEGGFCLINEEEEVLKGDWNSMLAYLENGLRTLTRSDVEKDRNLSIPNGSLFPSVTDDENNKIFLGADTILEGYAFACQQNLMRELEDEYTDFEINNLFDAFKPLFNDNIYMDTINLIRSEFKDIKNIDELVFHIVPALCDIALNGPLLPELHPLWQRTREGDKTLCWQDVHPGYRFVKAAKALNMSKALLGPDRAIDALKKNQKVIHSDILEVKDMVKIICYNLNWPTPEETAMELINVMDLSKKVDPEFLKLKKGEELEDVFYSPIDIYSYRLKMLNILSKIRVEEPDILSISNTRVAVNRILSSVPPILLKTPKGDIPLNSYGEVVKLWEIVFRIANTIVVDEESLRKILQRQEGSKAFNEYFGIEINDLIWC